MGFAVYHTEKGNISSGGIGNHIDRKKGAEHTFQHSDPDRLHLNKNFEITAHCTKPLHQAIEDRISEGYNARNKAGELKQIRKDAVKYSTHIFTGTHEDMKKIEQNPEEMNKWLKANLDFASKEFGKENIVRFTLHLDEKTPHIHCVTVNLTKDGRLSAKEIIGNKKQMQERQDRYAEAMKPFGLERGLRSTGIQHEDAKAYYTRMKEALEAGKQSEAIEVKKGIFSVDFARTNEKTIEKLSSENRALKTAYRANLDQLKKTTAERNIYSDNAKRHERRAKEKNEFANKLISDKKLWEDNRKLYIDYVAEKKIFHDIEGAIRKKVINSEKLVQPEEVRTITNQLFQQRLMQINVEERAEILKNKYVDEKMTKILNNAIKSQEIRIAELKEKQKKSEQSQGNDYWQKVQEIRNRNQQEQGQEKRRGFRR